MTRVHQPPWRQVETLLQSLKYSEAIQSVALSQMTGAAATEQWQALHGSICTYGAADTLPHRAAKCDGSGLCGEGDFKSTRTAVTASFFKDRPPPFST